MKFVKVLILNLSVIFILNGCELSNDPIDREIRAAYIESCKIKPSYNVNCKCLYDNVTKGLSREQILMWSWGAPFLEKRKDIIKPVLTEKDLITINNQFQIGIKNCPSYPRVVEPIK